MAIRILHFADVHLDTPFKWAAPAVARKRRQGLRDALSRVVDLVVAERVDAVTCGGDLYDQEYVSPDTAEFLRTTFDRIAPLPLFISPGNHDWLGPLSLYRRVRWGPHVRIFEEPRLRPIQLRPGVTLWGAAHRGPAGTPGFLDGFHVAGEGVHLALFHGSELGYLAAQDEGKTTHAPFRAEQIPASRLSYALLGHYHVPADRRFFTYPGNPDPLTFGEQGDRGAVLVTVDDEGGVSIERRHVAVSTVYATNSYQRVQPPGWQWHAWQGFFARLQDELGEGSWGYVPNPSGGFTGFWWHSRPLGNAQAYLQLENARLCFKISVRKEKERASVARSWSAHITKTHGLLGFEVVRPSRIMPGDTMTVAVRVGDYRAQDRDGQLDMDATLETLHAAETIMDRALEGGTREGGGN